MRVGIMGGTLDPVHNGHIAIAKAAMQAMALDRVMLLPAGDPPHKVHPILKTDRLQMTRLAAAKEPGLFACNIEIYRGGTTYTVDTLKELRRCNPSTEWFYIVGEDTLEVLDSWRNFSEVAGLCSFIAVGRGSKPVNMERAVQLEKQYGAKIIALSVAGPEISSTDIRARIAAGQSIEGLTPPAVEDYIRRRGLYLCDYTRPEILIWLRAHLKPARYTHTLGVAQTAKAMAERFGMDPMRADLAGLLHDCAKYMPLKDMRALVEGNIVDVDAEELATEAVLHAPAGCVLAQNEFGVRDPEILNAIRRHTLGDSGMRGLDAILYVADFIEPNRRDFPGLAQVRELAQSDLHSATIRCAELTSDYVRARGGKPHPRTLRILNDL